jgi:protease-4
MKRRPILTGLLVILGLLVFFSAFFLLLGRYSGKPDRRLASGGKVAVVEIRGVIAQSSGPINELHQYLEEEDVKAIVLRIDSPGGGVGPSQEIHREVVKARKKKKIITSMGSVAASGGYYVACATDLIVANPGTITGSIGVIMQFTNLEDLLKKIGIRGMVIKSGDHKDIGSVFRQMTPEEKEILQRVIDNVHQQFIQAVAEGRKMDRAKVASLADGRIMTGEQARAAGLVDQLGNLDDAIDSAAKLVGIKGKPQVLYPRKKITVWDVLMKDMANTLLEKLSEGGFDLSYRLPGTGE